MGDHPDKLKEFTDLIEGRRPRDAFVLFLDVTKGRPWPELVEYLPILDRVCRDLLPDLLENHTLWLVEYPDRLRRMLELLTQSLRAGYYPATTLDQIAHFRCLLAIGAARAGRLAQVHEELRLVPGEKDQPVPTPNGAFQEKVRTLQLRESSAVDFLNGLFAAYVEFLRRAERNELANDLEARLGHLLNSVARDEHRPGVVQALLCDGQRGYSRFVHVALEQVPPSETGPPSPEGIAYAGRPQDSIDGAMQEAASLARRAADGYLKGAGYPDGLAERLVRWELASLRGDSSGSAQEYRGGSMALPLAVAIVSEYLERPVPNDLALTGAFASATAEGGLVLPVDAIPEKIEHALLSGSRIVCLPAGNGAQLDERPSLLKLAQEHDARLQRVDRLDHLCGELFPPEGSGRWKDLLRDAALVYLRLVRPFAPPQPPLPHRVPYERHRRQALACSLLAAFLVFMEGWAVCRAFAPGFPSLGIWGRIVAAAVLAFAGVSFSCALPAACLWHRKRWAWIVGTVLTALCLGAGVAVLLPATSASAPASRLSGILPLAALSKDMLLIWTFCWALALNVFHVVACLEHLVKNRQFVTTRRCLRWESPLEARLPLWCVYFPWKEGALVLGVIGLALIAWEMITLAVVFKNLGEVATWMVTLTTCREFVFLIAIGQVMLFYKLALADIRKALA